MTELAATIEKSQLYRRSIEAAFPPTELMERVSSITNKMDFAKHGRDIFSALQTVSPKSMLEFKSILDFGIGSGRLARMFHDFTGSYAGVDVDCELINWINRSLPWVRAKVSVARGRLPFYDKTFDCVISVSVFTHMNKADSIFYLRELQRVTKPGAVLLLTVHGMVAIQRALDEKSVEEMLGITPASIVEAYRRLRDPEDGYCFANQASHLSTHAYDYGETFCSESYIHSEWGKHFAVLDIAHGAIHEFQDIVVLRRGD